MYVIKFIYGVLLFPPGIFIVGLLLLAWFRRRNRLLATASVVLAGLLYLSSIGLVGGAVIHSLESRHTPPAQAEGDVIVMLGGGVTLDTPNIGGQGHLYGHAANRLLTVLQLYHKLGVPIVVSGGQVFATTGIEAEVARSILISAGVPEGRIMTEGASLNTTENALYTAAILRQRGFKRPILVTSAFHMERAVLQFQKAGVTVTPFPTDYLVNRTKMFHYTDLWPSAGAMQGLTLGLKEYIGIAAARWY